jgi:hypothetical protein
LGLQFVGSFRIISDVIATNLDLVIGYLHWTFLGVVSIPILVFLHHFKLIQLSKNVIILYISGFLLTEGFLFYRGYIHYKKGIVAANFESYLAIASGLLFIAIALLLIYQRKRNSNF